MHLVFRMLAVASVAASGFAVLFALAPSVPVAFFADAGIEASLAIVGPACWPHCRLAIPSRARSIGFSIGALFVLPGLVVIPVVGAIGDAVGFRYGMLILVPVFLIGGLIVASAGSLIDADIKRCLALHANPRARCWRRGPGASCPCCRCASLDVGYDGVPVLRRGRHRDRRRGDRGPDRHQRRREVDPAAGHRRSHRGRQRRRHLRTGGTSPTPRPTRSPVWGVGQMPGGDGVFPTLTVEENLRAAAWQDRRHRHRAEVTGRRRSSAASTSWPTAGPIGPATSRVASSRCWRWPWPCCPPHSCCSSTSSPSGLAPLVVERLLDSVRALRPAGTAVLLVEQSVNVAVSVADRVYVMDSGAIRFSGPRRRRPRPPRAVVVDLPPPGGGRGGAGAGRRSPVAAALPSGSTRRRPDRAGRSRCRRCQRDLRGDRRPRRRDPGRRPRRGGGDHRAERSGQDHAASTSSPASRAPARGG